MRVPGQRRRLLAYALAGLTGFSVFFVGAYPVAGLCVHLAACGAAYADCRLCDEPRRARPRRSG